MGVISAVYGGICYLVFLASFLYSIGFVGDLFVPKTIDSAPSVGLAQALITDLILLSLFAVQHSIMARQGFKAVWTRLISPAIERSTFVLISSLLLALICWKWQAIPVVIWNVSSPVFSLVLMAMFALGWLILLLSTFMINHFDLFGLRQVYLRLRGLDYAPLSFSERALYRFVRHPIYLGFVIAFWSTPHMSLGHFVFACATTGYILVGIWFEERDLMQHHSVEYGAYRARVPMLLPTGTKRA